MPFARHTAAMYRRAEPCRHLRHVSEKSWHPLPPKTRSRRLLAGRRVSHLTAAYNGCMEETSDPVCGMKVDPERAAATLESGGRTYSFCSKSCYDKFRFDPGRYLCSSVLPPSTSSPPESPRPASAETVYTCPMHPEIRQSQAGVCSKCGMTLEPVTPKKPAVTTQYVCPMHPEIVRDEPGFCPICGMGLEPRTGTSGEEADPELVAMSRRFWVSLRYAAAVLYRHGRHHPRETARQSHFPVCRSVDRIRPVNSSGALGRVAVLPARLGVGGESSSQHVHADRCRSWRGISV